MKVPESALIAAHMRKRPELMARYLIKFIFPEDVLVRSNVYGARTGMDPLDHNKISALRGQWNAGKLIWNEHQFALQTVFPLMHNEFNTHFVFK